MSREENLHREAFQQFAEKAKEELGEDLKKLVLFGSVAKGEETEDSDVDVFAVVENEEQKKWLQRKGAEIGVEHGLMLTAIVRTVDEYEDVKDTPFGRELDRTGEVFV